MLATILYNDQSVCVSRCNRSGKTFSDDDVPHGTNSIICKSVSAMQTNKHWTSIIPVKLSSDEIDALIVARASSISAVDLYTAGEANKITMDRTEILNPTEVEIAYERVQKKLVESKYADNDEVIVALIADRKVSLATIQTEHRIKKFLDVPTLTDEFKSQFTITSNEE